jgi:gamma-glutamyltranspeptidase / glutathione hydrolase
MMVIHSNGTLHSVFGAGGGSYIITATVQSIIHTLDGGLSAADALAEPRLHDQLIPNRAIFEYSYDNATVLSMKCRGHNISWATINSAVQAVQEWPNGTFEATGEPRQKNSGGVAV